MIAKTRRCPHCGREAKRTKWLPTEGLDPNLREYCCKRCGHSFYHRYSDEEIRNARLQKR